MNMDSRANQLAWLHVAPIPHRVLHLYSSPLQAAPFLKRPRRGTRVSVLARAHAPVGDSSTNFGEASKNTSSISDVSDEVSELRKLVEKQQQLIEELGELMRSLTSTSTILAAQPAVASFQDERSAQDSEHSKTDERAAAGRQHFVPLGSRARPFVDAIVDLSEASIGKVVRTELDAFNARLPGNQRMSETDVLGFTRIFARYLKERSSKERSLSWDTIQSPTEEDLVPYDQIVSRSDDGSLREHSTAEARELLKKVAVLKLNGGLGTSMGCTGPKSAIEVIPDQSFMDLTVQQIAALNDTYGSDVPLLLMNSFNTHSDTEKILRKYGTSNVNIVRFYQSRFPRIQANVLSLLPSEFYVRTDSREGEGWYPPGHGDVYRSLQNSGVLDSLLEQGREYLFLSNIDNLGATVDLSILRYMDSDGGPDFAMELTDKTIADVKGGTLINYQGRKKLLEIAQVPKDHVEEFKSVRKFRVFNTNNLWVNLRALKTVLEEREDRIRPDLIVNKKQLSNGKSVIQLETAAGALIEYFERAKGINVPRTRFLPVKTTSDLLTVQSNLYKLDSQGNFCMNPRRQFSVAPHVKLGEEFKNVTDYAERLGSIPDIIDLEHLTVSGDVRFGKNVTLRGTVIIVANPGETITIPEGAILENNVCSGNLNILRM
ncbi:UTP--glucose-1-phosphate uridylyltransferase [Porphyridium purpureum]|uniref:UTP--glucose-1-phosphate uridylyltransferase n=1 Tax=Porphyridium purpureum TaxID=35688 RepID=A0A5J4Z9T7_PORPP|nr:UTP--glucose-1-phosphate uridylyltransferase [Porphyridium purpureum]|eukprot:POR8114..scf295_1